jgi:hypothetical protein
LILAADMRRPAGLSSSKVFHNTPAGFDALAQIDEAGRVAERGRSLLEQHHLPVEDVLAGHRSPVSRRSLKTIFRAIIMLTTGQQTCSL